MSGKQPHLIFMEEETMTAGIALQWLNELQPTDKATESSWGRMSGLTGYMQKFD